MKRFAYISTLALCVGGVAHAEEYETAPYEASVEAFVGQQQQQLAPLLYSAGLIQSPEERL